MAEHYVLCVLSQVNAERAVTQEYTFIKNGKPYASFLGYQTNEAPVECLIKLALNEGNPVTGIICLVSEECRKPITTCDGVECAALSHFVDAVVDFCDSCEGLSGENNPARKDGFFKEVEYEAKNPAQSLRRIVEVLDKEVALIDIDTTGGPRDAAFLLTNVVQFIEAKHHTYDGTRADMPKAYGLGN